MSDPDENSLGHAPRDQTDESLRVEREKADAAVMAKRETVDAQADEVVRLARERADEVTATARDDADRLSPKPPRDGEVGSTGQRAQADRILERERVIEDAVLLDERAARRRYLDDLLSAERSATDHDLIAERAHADTAVGSRDDFLATVSHDLRSLLCGLTLNAALMSDLAPADPGGDKLRVNAARGRRLVSRMNRLVNDLLDVASIEAGRLALFPEQVEIAHLLRDTLEAFEPVAAAKHVALDARADGAPSAWLDEGRILQVLANLVGNGIKFTPAEGRVSIAAHTDGAEVHFTVTDTGIGIPEETREGVFERFRQVRSDPRGLGLGLHIARSIVAAHGGRMWVEGQLGAGSVFHFTLPVGADGRMNAPESPRRTADA